MTYARQAITTKYHGPTDHRGSRVTAKCDAGRITVPWDHSLDSTENHAAAVRALIHKLGWNGTFYLGGTSDGYVAVWAEKGARI